MALSDTLIKANKHKDDNGNVKIPPYKLYDSEGLYLQVTPTGGKWWRLKYRFGGKEKLLSLGTYPEVSLSEARDRRASARTLLAKETPIDPSENRKMIKP